MLSEVLNNLLTQLAKLPGIGPRSAERIAYHLLRTEADEVFRLAEAIRDVKNKLRPCRECFNLTDEDPCSLCRDPRRDHTLLCVVEQPKDLMAIESTGAFSGVYHVLMGHLAPLEGIEAEDLTIAALLDRVRRGGVREVVMATNPTLEGDGTALHIAQALRDLGVRVTRLARGLSVGGQLEFTTKATLADALAERRAL